MITLLKSYTTNFTGKDDIIKSRAVMKLAGLSTDEKPLIKFKDIEIENGSSFIEIDTSKIYKYDEENRKWIKQKGKDGNDISISQEEIDDLLIYINEIINDENNTDLSHAVITLANGYGKYGIDDLATGVEPSGDLIINIAESIKSEFVYRNLNVTSVTAPNVIDVNSNAFNGCSNLTFVNMPNVTIIGQSAFHACSNLTSINAPKVTIINPSAFYSCSKLISIDIPNVTTIGLSAFTACSNLTSINAPKVTVINRSTFK